MISLQADPKNYDTFQRRQFKTGALNQTLRAFIQYFSKLHQGQSTHPDQYWTSSPRDSIWKTKAECLSVYLGTRKTTKTADHISRVTGDMATNNKAPLECQLLLSYCSFPEPKFEGLV